MLTGKPIAITCAYSGRVAIAYKLGGVKVKSDTPRKQFVNIGVSVYECESTGKKYFIVLFFQQLNQSFNTAKK